MKKFIIPGSSVYFFYDEKETTEGEVASYLNAVRAALPDLKHSDLELQDLLSSGGLKYALQKHILERDFSIPTLVTFSVIVPETQAQVDTLNGAAQAYCPETSTFEVGKASVIGTGNASILKAIADVCSVPVKTFTSVGSDSVVVNTSDYLYSRREVDEANSKIRGLTELLASLDNTKLQEVYTNLEQVANNCAAWRSECLDNIKNLSSTISKVEEVVGGVRSEMNSINSVEHDYREWADVLSNLAQSIISLKGSLVYSYQQFVAEATSTTNLKHDLLNGVTNNLEQIEDLVKQFDKFTEFNKAIQDLIIELKSNIAEAELILSYAPTQAQILSLLQARHTVEDIKNISETAVNVKNLMKKQNDDIFG